MIDDGKLLLFPLDIPLESKRRRRRLLQQARLSNPFASRYAAGRINSRCERLPGVAAIELALPSFREGTPTQQTM